MTPKDFTVGQELCYVRNGQCRSHRVLKVGRSWITTCEEGNETKDWLHVRFSPKTMLADGRGYCSPGTFYLSEKDYRDEKDRERVWYDLRKYFDDSRYKGGVADCKLSTARLREILAELKGEEANG